MQLPFEFPPGGKIIFCKIVTMQFLCCIHLKKTTARSSQKYESPGNLLNCIVKIVNLILADAIG